MEEVHHGDVGSRGCIQYLLVDTVRADLDKSGGEGPGRLTEHMLGIKKRDLKALDMLAERQFAGVPSVMFAAGVETTASTINTAIFAFVTHRNTFLALQKEIDSVVGDSRSPTFKDMSKLPYLNAVVQETLRWPASVTVGVPHATTDDDVYEGWVILKGTSVISNAWAINHNLAFFLSGHTFALERYLPPSGPRFNYSLVGEEFPGKWGHGTFGWGRRVCSGADLAMNSLRIVIAKLV
jgi:cytochrome P450